MAQDIRLPCRAGEVGGGFDFAEVTAGDFAEGAVGSVSWRGRCGRAKRRGRRAPGGCWLARPVACLSEWKARCFLRPSGENAAGMLSIHAARPARALVSL